MVRTALTWPATLTVSVLLASLLAGCGDAPPEFAKELVPASGTVTLDGEPVEGAVVSFMAMEGASRTSTGVTDAQGHFTVTTPTAGEGIVPGPYEVVINKFTLPDGSPLPEDTAPMDVGAEEQLPERYSSFATPTLSAEVSTLGGTFDFELKSK